MTTSDFRDPRLTEQRNPRTERIDVASSLEIVDLMNGEDTRVAGAVQAERERIAAAIDLVVAAFQKGGRPGDVGAGAAGGAGGPAPTRGAPPIWKPPTEGPGATPGGHRRGVERARGGRG